MMTKGGAFRLVGMILGIVGTVTSITAIVFSGMGMMLSRRVVRPRVRK